MSAAPSRARRRWLGGSLAAAALGPWLAGCQQRPEPLRVGAQVFPGYELLFLARSLQRLDERLVRLIEMPSASASLRALASGALEAACLTLDEVLAARDRGVPMTAVLVFDVSMGADAVLARPGIDTLAALRGRRIGVEQSAVGAVMLDAALRAGGLRPADVQVVALPVDEHERAYVGGRVDAVVTYEPTRRRLLDAGARLLFSSRDEPGLVLDVLAVRAELVDSHQPAIEAAVAAHLELRDAFVRAPAQYAERLAPRLGLPAAAVPAAFENLELPDRARNREWLNTPDGLLAASQRLHAAMRRSGLVHGAFDARGLLDPRFVSER